MNGRGFGLKRPLSDLPLADRPLTDRPCSDRPCSDHPLSEPINETHEREFSKPRRVRLIDIPINFAKMYVCIYYNVIG